MKNRHSLCKCDNCGTIMFDYNPSTDSYLFADDDLVGIKVKNTVETVNRSGDYILACPECKTADYLTDIMSPDDIDMCNMIAEPQRDNGIPVNASYDRPKKRKRTGGKTDYYNVFTDCTDVDSFCMEHNLSGFEFNVLKALVGIVNTNNGKGARHGDSSLLIDVNKLVYYAGKMREKILIERGQSDE